MSSVQYILVVPRRPNSERDHFSAFFIEFDNAHSYEILGLVYVKYVLSESGPILKTVTTFNCPKSGINLVTRWHFTSIIQYINVIVGLELLIIGTNVTTVFLCTEGKI